MKNNKIKFKYFSLIYKDTLEITQLRWNDRDNWYENIYSNNLKAVMNNGEYKVV